MKRKFIVDITASVSKQIPVSAYTQAEAEEQAHQIFADYWNSLEGVPEIFEQDTYDIGEV
jgi:hypothetical protein|tara:strand:+ start:203 stop:382 length:180 start_codon:yes stop_codon:yes gene_type:complete